MKNKKNLKIIRPTSYNLGHLWKIFIEYMLVLTEQLGSTDERHLEPKRRFFAVDRWSTQCKRSLSFWLALLSSVNSFRIDSTGLVVASCCVGAPSKHPSWEAMLALFTNRLDKDHWTQTNDRRTKIIQMTRKFKWVSTRFHTSKWHDVIHFLRTTIRRLQVYDFGKQMED